MIRLLKKLDYAKKNLPSGEPLNFSSLLGYRFPVFHDTASGCYVDFYAFDPITGKQQRKKIYLDKYKSKKEKKLHANIIISTLTQKLLSGWNPWCDVKRSRSFTPFRDVIDRYLEYVAKTGRKKTIQNYSSRCKILEEYNATRFQPITYAYQYTRDFVMEFLDWILLDRDNGPRTRNNYKGWCSALGEFMKDRKYIDENPAASIPKIPEDEKKRQPLSPSMVRQMQRHLAKEDPHFLLAVMMEYYTFIRPSELSAIRINDISIKEQRIFVSRDISKNKRDGYVGLNETLIRMMLELGVFSHPGDCYLFSRGFRPDIRKMGPDIFNKRWATMRKALKWGSEYQFYSMKDTGIRDLANAEGIVIARDQARHTDISTTNKYLGIDRNVHAETKRFKGEFD